MSPKLTADGKESHSNTGDANEWFGDLLEATQAAGADAVAGFTDEISIWYGKCWHRWFWHYLCVEGDTVEEAHDDAIGELEEHYPGDPLWQSLRYLRIINPGLRARPPRWGE